MRLADGLGVGVAGASLMSGRNELGIEPGAEVRGLQRRLKVLMRWAEDNEERYRRFHAQELLLLSTTSLYELLLMVVHETRVKFRLDVITLAVIDPDHEIRHLLQHGGTDIDNLPQVVFVDRLGGLDALFAEPRAPRLGRTQPDHGALFPPALPQPASVALLPLVREGRIVGSLNLGSCDQERYRGTHSTDFLAHFGAVVAVCLENALNHERLRRVGLTDTLTGVSNRRYFDGRLAEELRRVQRERQALSCLFLDVDHFKRVNDTHGHGVGDYVLQDVARIIRAHLRNIDILARYGGEEFTALLPGTGREEALMVAERIRRAVRGHRFAYSGVDPLAITISVGISVLARVDRAVDPDEAGRELLERADQALYLAKEGGRDRVVAEDSSQAS